MSPNLSGKSAHQHMGYGCHFFAYHYTHESLEHITKVFLWYKQMDALMGTSPIVNTSAIANSTSEIDLTALMPSNGTSKKEITKRTNKGVGHVQFIMCCY